MNLTQHIQHAVNDMSPWVHLRSDIEITRHGAVRRVVWSIADVVGGLKLANTLKHDGLEDGDLRVCLILKADLPSGSEAEVILKVLSGECLDCQLFVGEQVAPRAPAHDFGERSILTWLCDTDWLSDVKDGVLKVGVFIHDD
eukprot:NODE_4073_length_713_cov_281.189970.p2 GENE.NODE_4073_length_713_cov_281.189970~~NODE_4073_length_713_cov_281.189970.p2  ORF type:complete len:142 (-),score=32.94 NODE_4073_length_713_cov_281.189970:217-642(-)